MQGCIRFLIPGNIKSVGEEYQVVKRGRTYHGCGEEYNVEKRQRGSNVIFPVILRLLGRISIGEEDGNFREENQGKKMGVGKKSSCKELYTPLENVYHF